MSLRMLFIGDIVGRAGRTVVADRLPALREELALDFVVANGENAAGGFGLTAAVADDLFAAGIDCLTSGNHIWDQKEIIGHMEVEPRILRPLNYPEGTPGRGVGVFPVADGRQIFVANVMGRVFMDPLDDPFAAIDRALADLTLGRDVDCAFVDVHGEATSEKMAMGRFLDGRVSLVVGSHSHVPTADAQILPEGTAYQTDAGMTGDYDSVIGMEPEEPLNRFVRKISKRRFSPAMGPATLCAVFAEIDEKSGLAHRVAPLRVGGRLEATKPALS